MLARRLALGMARSYRKASTSTFAVADDVFDSALEAQGPIPRTVSSVLHHTPSEKFVRSWADTHINSLVRPETDTKVQSEMHYWLERNDYDALADFVLTLTASPAWTSHISTSQLGYFVRQLAQHQIALNKDLAMAKNVRHDSVAIDSKAAEARSFRNKIRNVYSNLLFGTSRVSVYDRSLRRDLYSAETLTGYRLTVQDYETLIIFEYNNFKLDLAAKWFERFEAQYGLQHMTKEMWQLRFQVFGRGDTKLWSAFHNELVDHDRQLVLGKVQRKSLASLLKEYLSYNKDVEYDMLATMIHCLGNTRNIDQLYGLIQDKWGVDRKGQKVGSAARAPTLEVLRAIVVALSHNQEYYQAMVYVNSFQDHFHIKLSGKEAIPFWVDLFNTSDLTTRYNRNLALKYYIENFNTEVNFDKLETLQQNAQFDYEGYLTFIDELKKKRHNIMTSIWQLYCATNNTFSTACYRTYYRFLVQSEQDSEFYSMLELMNQKYWSYHVSSTSFNAGSLNATADGIYRLYINTMVGLIKAKCTKGFFDQCGYLIDEWSLDPAMAAKLHKLFAKKLKPAYQTKLDAKRKLMMIQQRSDDRFLDLL